GAGAAVRPPRDRTPAGMRGSRSAPVERPTDPLQTHRLRPRQVLGEETEPELLDEPADPGELGGDVGRERERPAGLEVQRCRRLDLALPHAVATRLLREARDPVPQALEVDAIAGETLGARDGDETRVDERVELPAGVPERRDERETRRVPDR